MKKESYIALKWVMPIFDLYIFSCRTVSSIIQSSVILLPVVSYHCDSIYIMRNLLDQLFETTEMGEREGVSLL
jgi:hypothetical protein